MYASINHGKQRILSASEMSKTKNCELLVQRIFHVMQYDQRYAIPVVVQLLHNFLTTAQFLFYYCT